MSVNSDPGPDSRDLLQRSVNAAAALNLISGPNSREVSELSGTYAGGRVRRYGFSAVNTSRRTEIELSDGRKVLVHQNVYPVMGLSAPRYDAIEVVQTDGQVIDTIELQVNERSSPTNPTYSARLHGKDIYMGADGPDLDLDLADGLLENAVSDEICHDRGYARQRLFHGAGFLPNVITAMTPGYDESMIEPGILREISSTQPSTV